MRNLMVCYNRKKKRLLTNKSTYMRTPKQTVAPNTIPTSHNFRLQTLPRNS